MQKQIKALIVDDDESFLKLFSKILKNKGCSTSVASNHQDSLRFLVNQIYHVAFIDCILFSEEGTQLVEKIRSILGYSVDIVLMSGVLNEENIKDIKNMDQVSFLQKPLKTRSLDSIIKKVQNKFIYGEINSFLLRLFDKDVSQTAKLKLLFNLKKLNQIEFLLALVKLVDSEEKGSIEFSFDDQIKHKVFFENRMMTNYVCYGTDIFLSRLVSCGALSERDKHKVRHLNPEDLDHEIIAQCYAAPQTVAKEKIDLFLKVLNSIPTVKEIKLDCKLFSTSHNFFQLDNKWLTQPMLPLLSQMDISYFNNLFGEDAMDATFSFKEKSNALNDLEGIRSKGRLKDLKAHKKFKTPLEFFCFVLSHLMTSDLALEPAEKESEFYLKRRFKSLNAYVQNQEPEELIKRIGQYSKHESFSNDKIKEIYLNFIRFNHTDKLDSLDEETGKLVRSICDKVKKAHDTLIDPKANLLIVEKARSEQMNKEIKRAEDKKLAHHLLESEEYQKALDTILAQDSRIVDKDLDWQILHLWAIYKLNNESDIKDTKTKKFLNNVIRDALNLDSKNLYFYVLGLHYKHIKKEDKAISNLQKSKLIDPSFKPVSKDLKVLFLDKNKRQKKSPLHKISSLLRKKTG